MIDWDYERSRCWFPQKDDPRPIHAWLVVLVKRLTIWEEKETSDNQEAEELLLDIKQCLESLLE